MIGALVLIGATRVPIRLNAQSTASIILTIEDSRSAALPGAIVSDPAGQLLGRTDATGHLTVPCAAPCRLRVSAQGFAPKSLQVMGDTTLRLDPAANTEEVTVTAYRTPLGTLESPVTTRILSEAALNSTAAITLDEKLRQLPGVQLYRRSTSLAANPSSQGLSLRGLGSTAASRTLITEDDVPLNDPFAGWIRWQEQPELSLKSVELVRGGASDLYGSSAIGGVVNLIPARPTSNFAELRSTGGSEGMYDNGLRLQTRHGPWGALLAGGLLATDGYIQEAPWQRGPVDIASNVHSQNGVLLAEHERGPLRLFVRGSGFNDARSNGTPDQTNGTRLWRYATGADWQGPRDGSLVTRVYGSTEHFRQVFSSISNTPTAADPACTLRCGEAPTRFSLSPENELGAVAHWSQPLGAGLLFVAGADTHDVRVWDREQTFGATAALTNLRDHQRDTGAYGEAMWLHGSWTLTASAREDWFQNFDGQQLLFNGSAWVPSLPQPSQFDQHVFDPRMGISRRFLEHWAVSASGFRAFRAPSPNELYRTTQVGNMLTKPNFNLLSERATGWETGAATEWHWGTIRASYFLTQVNRPIAALTLNPNSSPILLMRENLGQIESRGLALDFELAPQRWLSVNGGYQYAHATVSRGTQDLGNWIPEVARNMATLNLRAFRPRLGLLSLQSGSAAASTTTTPTPIFSTDSSALTRMPRTIFGRRLQLFAAGENLFDRDIEVGKTPTTTLAQPRTARVGFLFRLGEAAP